MKEKKFIKKASSVEIFNHWLLAISFLCLVFTGVGILFRVKGIISLFETYYAMLSFHEIWGVVFVVSLAFTAFSYLEESLRFDLDDVRWLKKFGCYLSKCTDAPPQGRLTAAQKIFYLFIFTTGLIMSVTGFLIWLDFKNIQSWIDELLLIHKVVFYAMIVVVPIHMLMVTFVIPKTLRVIFLGTMSLEWAKQHHSKWLSRRREDREL